MKTLALTNPSGYTTYVVVSKICAITPYTANSSEYARITLDGGEEITVTESAGTVNSKLTKAGVPIDYLAAGRACVELLADARALTAEHYQRVVENPVEFATVIERALRE